MDGAAVRVGQGPVHEFNGPVDSEGLPEYFLRVGGIEIDGDRTSATVETGPWLSWDGGAASVGSLGVLFDNVLAYPMLNGAPRRFTLVSSEITIDAMAPVPVDGQLLFARARLVHRDERSAFARGELCTADGMPVAVAAQRGRFVPATGVPVYDYGQLGTGSSTSTLPDLVWPGGPAPRLTADGRLEIVVGSRLGNHMDNLHGGLSLLLAERAAIAAVRARDSDLATVSVRIAYSRPLPVGTTVTFETSVLHLGRTTANVAVVGRNDAGKCGVAATVSFG